MNKHRMSFCYVILYSIYHVYELESTEPRLLLEYFYVSAGRVQWPRSLLERRRGFIRTRNNSVY